MFIEASDKTLWGEYNNVNLDYVKSYNIENGHKFKKEINYIVFKVEGEECPIRFSFDNYDDALLAIDAIRFLQKGITYDLKGKEKKINQECNLYNLDEIVFGLKNRKETEQLMNKIFNIVQ